MSFPRVGFGWLPTLIDCGVALAVGRFILVLDSLRFLPGGAAFIEEFLHQVHSKENRFVPCPGCCLLELLALAHVATLRDFITTDVIIPLSHVMPGDSKSPFHLCAVQQVAID